MRPSTYQDRPELRFNCQRCGCEVYRPQRDRFDDWICMNCRFSRVQGAGDDR
jgi:hypothetical protein